MSIRREIEDQIGIAQTLNNLGTIYQDDGEHAKAVDFYEEALEVAKRVGDRMRQAVVLTNLGESQYRMEEPAKAISTLQDAEKLSSALGDLLLEGEVLRGLAKAHMLIHDFSVARDYIARSIELFEEARGKPFLGVAWRTLGEITSAAGWGGEDHKHARQAFQKSISLFEELGNQIELANSLEAYASFLEESEEYKEKAHVVEEAKELRRRAHEFRERLRATETSYEFGIAATITDPEMVTLEETEPA